MSEQYKALTRKYRPVSFEDIVSQEHVSSTLKNAIKNNRISHAYLFCGPRGVGKTTMARVFARTINGISADVDGEALNNTLNIIEVDAASNNKVEDAQRIREAVRVPPQSGTYKIFIIDEVHMLSKSAFNALLKTLEEPPAHAIFIFATTEPHKVLPTILSRVQRFDFRSIQVSEIVDRLRAICDTEKITIDDESLHIIGRKADGALRDALGILDQVIAFCGTEIKHQAMLDALNVVGSDRLFQLMDFVSDKDTTGGIKLVSDLLYEGHDIQEFLISLTEHLRNLTLAKDKRNLFAIDVSKEHKQRLMEAAANFSDDDLLRMLHLVHEAQFKVRDAHQPRILLEMTILKLIRMEKTDGLASLLHELKSMSGNASSGQTAQVNATSEPEVKHQSSANRPASSGASYGGNSGTTAQTTSTPPAPATPKKDLFGKPSLSRTRNRLTRVGDNAVSTKKPDDQPETGMIDGNLAIKTDPSPDQNEQENGEAKTVYLHDIKEKWSVCLSELEKVLPGYVCVSLTNTRPANLKNRELVLECNDELASKLVEEHQSTISQKLASTLGGYTLRLRPRVRKPDPEQDDSDPYNRYKKLLEKDDQLRIIVDLFGAELDFSER